MNFLFRFSTFGISNERHADARRAADELDRDVLERDHAHHALVRCALRCEPDASPRNRQTFLDVWQSFQQAFDESTSFQIVISIYRQVKTCHFCKTKREKKPTL